MAAGPHGERWRVLLVGPRQGLVEVPNRQAFGPRCPVFVAAVGRPTDQYG